VGGEATRYKFPDIRPFVSFEMGQFSRDLMVIAFLGGHIAFHPVQCVRPIYQGASLSSALLGSPRRGPLPDKGGCGCRGGVGGRGEGGGGGGEETRGTDRRTGGDGEKEEARAREREREERTCVSVCVCTCARVALRARGTRSRTGDAARDRERERERERESSGRRGGEEERRKRRRRDVDRAATGNPSAAEHSSPLGGRALPDCRREVAEVWPRS